MESRDKNALASTTGKAVNRHDGHSLMAQEQDDDESQIGGDKYKQREGRSFHGAVHWTGKQGSVPVPSVKGTVGE